jgi:hypothetical protein
MIKQIAERLDVVRELSHPEEFRCGFNLELK